MKPLVSIISLAYNHEAFIKDALDSFLIQKTNFDYEIIIHDDASTDKTQNIIKEYVSKHPLIFRPIYQTENQKSKGQGIVTKTVFNAAKGKYIAFCEGDDYWTDPNKLQKQVDFLEANSDYVITYHNAKIIDSRGKTLSESKLTDDLKRDYSGEELIQGKMILTLTMMFRNVIKEFPDEMMQVKNGDKFLTSLLGNYGKGKYLSEIKNDVYRKHSNSIWSSLDEVSQIFFNGDTRAWLYRYYKKIGNSKAANFFKNEVENHFKIVLSKLNQVYSIENNKITEAIFTKYKDILSTEKLESFSNQFKKSDLHSSVQNNNQTKQKNIYQAENYLQAGKTNEAREILNYLIKQNPNDIDLLNDIVVVDILEGNFEQALNNLNLVLKLDPQNEIAIENYKYLLELTKDKIQRHNSNYNYSNKESLQKEELKIVGAGCEILEKKLNEKKWLYKYDLYNNYYSFSEEIQKVEKPKISIIVISWRLHPDNLKSFQILEKQRDHNYELIFVDNGGKEGEFDLLKPFINTYIKLNTNTGAYLTRNIGAAFANAPILFFLEDDGIPADNIIEAHLDTHKKYDIVAARGVYIPKTQGNSFNKLAHHYYLGDKTYPRYCDLEGNCSYSSSAFYNVGGWDDEIKFGGGGIDLAIRLLEKYPEINKQIYSPLPVIYHDYVADEKHLKIKKDKQLKSFQRLAIKHANWTKFQLDWNQYAGREDMLKLNNYNQVNDVIMVWYQNDWGLFGRRNEMFARELLNNKRIRKVIHIEPPVNIEDQVIPDTKVDLLNKNINAKRINRFNDNGVLTFTPSYSGKLDLQKVDSIFSQVEEVIKTESLNNIILWIYPPHWFSTEMLKRYRSKASLVITDLVDDHRKYAANKNDYKEINDRYVVCIRNSNLTITVSPFLENDFKEFTDNIHFVPNAVNPKTLLPQEAKLPEELKKLSRPIVGYVGALSFRLDNKLIENFVISNRDINFVFIGPSPSQAVLELSKAENVHLLEPKCNDEINRYIQAFDVCIVPHLVDDITNKMNPLKIYEYLANGKPVVSTRIAGTENFNELIYLADDANDFSLLIRKAIEEDSEIKFSARKNFCKNHTWKNRIDSILNLLNTKNGLKNPLGGKEKMTDKYYQYSRPEVQELVSNESEIILDIGCSAGNLGYELKSTKKIKEVWGIEPFESVAKEAMEKLDKVIINKVEDSITQLPDKKFDTIIMADVLEHLENPYKVLEDLKSKLSANGEIIISIPNVNHWTVFKNMLAGEWEYEEAGILDKTHLRFFTKKSVIRMLVKAGYDISEMKATAFGQFNLSPESLEALKKDGIDVSNLNDNLNHYQYLVKGTLSKPLKKTSVIIPVYNQLDYTKKFIDSLYKFTSSSFELIIVDNGSNSETGQYLKGMDGKDNRVKVIYNQNNAGFPIAVNQGIKAASGDYILIANNDIIVTEGWLEKMIEAAESDPLIGLIGPISNSVSGVQLDKDAAYSSIEEMHAYAKKNRINNAGKRFIFPRVAFLCTLIKKEVIDKIGGLDERFTPGNFEDDDFCLRAQLAGFKTVIAKDVFIHHFGSKSFTADGKEKYLQRLQLNKNIFIEKWGADPEEIWLHGKPIKERNIVYTIDNKFAESLNRTAIHVNEKEFEQAFHTVKETVKNYNPEVDSNAGYIQVLCLAGNIALILEKTDEARPYFEKALEEDSSSSEACAGLAEIFYIEKNYEAAKTMFEYALNFNEKNDSAVIGLEKVTSAMEIAPGFNETPAAVKINKRDQLGYLLNSLNLLGHGVEIGVQAGEFSRIIRSTWKGKYLHLVDRWSNDTGYKDIANVSDDQQKQLYNQVVNTFLNDPDVFVYKMDSSFAVQQFKDEHFDWIYIDADHSYNGCKRDLNSWYPKLKPGGVFAGHDFIDGNLTAGEFGVKSAVEEFIKDKNVDLHITEEDHWKSWYFIKPAGAHENLENEFHSTLPSLNKDDEENTDNLVNTAYALFKTGEYDNSLKKLLIAEESFNGHLSIPENSVMAAAFFNLKGFNYLGLNKIEEAKEHFERALNLDPDSSEACAGLGEYFYLSGNDDHARLMFEFAIKNNPENSFAIEGLSKVNTISDLNDKEDDSENLKKTLSEILSSVFQLFELKKYSEALDSLLNTEQIFYSQLDKEKENHLVSAFENLKGIILLALNRTEKAKESFELALNINPLSSQACAGLGEVLFLSGKDSEAKAMYEKAVKNNPENKFAKEGLGKINLILGFDKEQNNLLPVK